MTNSNIETELLKSHEAAERGYVLSSKKYLEIVKTLKEAARNIEIVNSKKNKIPQLQNNALLAKQDQEMHDLKKSVVVIRENINALHERQKDFSVVVFGRAMSGKSTLMEILTHGDGSSIGTGGGH